MLPRWLRQGNAKTPADEKMTDKKTEYEHIDLNDRDGPDEPLPAYSTTWGNDVVQESERPKRRGSIAWALAMDSTKQRAQTIAKQTPPYLRNTVWPVMKKIRFSKVQFYAFWLVAIFGLAPFITIALLTDYGNYGQTRPFYGVFADKTLSCGDAFGTPQNSTVSGWEALFVLDTTFGRLTFSQAKVTDVAWDLFVGRGVQLLAWWASYIVFTDALLRVIERHPTSYQTFARICLEGPCMASMWALMKDLGRTKSKRTWLLYFYMVISVLYTLCVPLFLGAMTGYINNTVAWVDIDNSNNLIPVLHLAAVVRVYAALSCVIEKPLLTSLLLNCASCHTVYMLRTQKKLIMIHTPESIVEKPHWYVSFAVSGRHLLLSSISSNGYPFSSRQ